MLSEVNRMYRPEGTGAALAIAGHAVRAGTCSLRAGRGHTSISPRATPPTPADRVESLISSQSEALTESSTATVTGATDTAHRARPAAVPFCHVTCYIALSLSSVERGPLESMTGWSSWQFGAHGGGRGRCDAPSNGSRAPGYAWRRAAAGSSCCDPCAVARPIRALSMTRISRAFCGANAGVTGALACGRMGRRSNARSSGRCSYCAREPSTGFFRPRPQLVGNPRVLNTGLTRLPVARSERYRAPLTHASLVLVGEPG